jgi:hypothetical protein
MRGIPDKTDEGGVQKRFAPCESDADRAEITEFFQAFSQDLLIYRI